MLVVNNIEVLYDHVILVLKGVSLNVPRGGIVALLGANGSQTLVRLWFAATGPGPSSQVLSLPVLSALPGLDLTPGLLVAPGGVTVGP